ncbi:MAG TPA: HesA/MoeB/ThiF family protein [Pseudothermotoga sp.]|nr:HesA/MoeB/ThiF family protein [Pseudothermotoga sp.]HOK83181.1 HesA/MoeB/ThiF family protein [Pseudothermotoga sp.]HPP69647.1 HesA/MoeB/ThiF family protein [Pseudothermotoga sp.]
MFQRHSELLNECMNKIFQAKVLVAGAGGLGCTVLSLLARVGVGNIYLVDGGIVDEPDLNRQILYDWESLGKPKVHAAKEKLSKINPSCNVVAVEKTIDDSFSLTEVDVVVDCLDNFRSKLVLDRVCRERSIPLVHAGVEKFTGQVTTILYGRTPALSELFRGSKDREVSQIFPPLVSLIASIQASEVIKLICGKEETLAGKILLVDLLNNRFETVRTI